MKLKLSGILQAHIWLGVYGCPMEPTAMILTLKVTSAKFLNYVTFYFITLKNKSISNNGHSTINKVHMYSCKAAHLEKTDDIRHKLDKISIK